MPTRSGPAELQPYLSKGVEAYTEGCYEYAIDLFSYVVRRAPDATEARRYLRLAVQQQWSRHPPSPLSQAGWLLLTLPIRWWAALAAFQGNTRQAIALYEWLLGLMPRSRALLMRLGAALARSGHPEAATQTYEELLAVDPNHIGALRHLARLAMKGGNDPLARRCFERLLKLHPGDLEAQQSLRNLDALSTIKRGFST